jgi:hypothetical protein
MWVVVVLELVLLSYFTTVFVAYVQPLRHIMECILWIPHVAHADLFIKQPLPYYNNCAGNTSAGEVLQGGEWGAGQGRCLCISIDCLHNRQAVCVCWLKVCQCAG